jgi:hypothetical protein
MSGEPWNRITGLKDSNPAHRFSGWPFYSAVYFDAQGGAHKAEM